MSAEERGRGPARRSLRRDVRERLVGSLAAGRWSAGDRLPSEPKLARALGVSRATLRDALRSLEEDGFVTREHGSGTFVTFRPRLANNLDVNFGVTQLIEAHGLEPGVRSLSVTRSPADEEASRTLALAAGDLVVAVDRVRTADGVPVVLSCDTLPLALFERRPEVVERLGRGSLYELLERELEIVVEQGVASIRPETARGAAATLLERPEGALLLFLEQVDYDVEGRPVMLSREHHVADAFEMTVLRRGPGRRAA